MSLSTRWAPSSAKRKAMASPMPAPTPVTMAVLPFNRMAGGLLVDGRRGQFAARNHAVDHAVLNRLLGAHDVIAIHVAGDALHSLAGIIRQDLVEGLAHA